jgi:hypothetical protein
LAIDGNGIVDQRVERNTGQRERAEVQPHAVRVRGKEFVESSHRLAANAAVGVEILLLLEFLDRSFGFGAEDAVRAARAAGRSRQLESEVEECHLQKMHRDVVGAPNERRRVAGGAL